MPLDLPVTGIAAPSRRSMCGGRWPRLLTVARSSSLARRHARHAALPTRSYLNATGVEDHRKRPATDCRQQSARRGTGLPTDVRFGATAAAPNTAMPVKITRVEPTAVSQPPSRARTPGAYRKLVHVRVPLGVLDFVRHRIWVGGGQQGASRPPSSIRPRSSAAGRSREAVRRRRLIPVAKSGLQAGEPETALNPASCDTPRVASRRQSPPESGHRPGTAPGFPRHGGSAPRRCDVHRQGSRSRSPRHRSPEWRPGTEP